MGFELTDTMIVFAEKGIYILASKKKMDFLKSLKPMKESEKDVLPVNLGSKQGGQRPDKLREAGLSLHLLRIEK